MWPVSGNDVAGRRNQEAETMSSTRVETVSVPGARLHCEISGSGPLLLLIPGAAADAGALTGLVTRLSGKYTVLTYDLRGLSRSPLDGPAQDLGIEILGDDAHRILAAFSSEPALVLGCSGGALIGLELTARHPQQVSVLIAHEPPVIALLPNRQQWQDFVDELEQLYRSAGAGVAMSRFVDGIEAVPGPGVSRAGRSSGRPPGQLPDLSKMTPQAREFMMRSHANMSAFFAHQIRGAASYLPDFQALSRVPSRIVVAVGAASNGQAPHEAAVRLAERLGIEVAEFPGDHQGFAAKPTEFAAAVDRLLSEG
jgi:pimeloyl-ACP methyl ester carboxylesterase